MPSKSAAQERMMAAAAHNPKFARKIGVPQDVAREFSSADKGRTRSRPMKADASKRARKMSRKGRK